jgi:hypothetical protein
MKKRSGIWLGLLLVAIALANELLKAPEARTWHDQLFGVLPYDFRFPTWARLRKTVWNPLPTWARLRKTVWNPHSDRIFVPHAFGVGWSVNLGGLVNHIGRVDG